MPLATILPFVAPVLGIAGTALDIAGNAEDQSAENKARSQENQEQSALQNKASQALATNVQANTPANVNKELSQGAGTRGNAWQGLNQLTAPVATALPATGGSSPTSNAQKVSGSTANTWNNLVSGDAAKLGSYSDLATQQGIQDQNTAEQLGMYNNFSQGDAALLPLELQVASQKGDQLSGWGQILGSLGSLAGLAGGGGGIGSIVGALGGLAGTAGSVAQGPYSSPTNWSTPGATPTPGVNWSNQIPIGSPGATLPASNVPNFWTSIYA